MSDPDRLIARASTPVDIAAALETLPCDAVDVNETRTVVIYQGAILILNVRTGTLTAAAEFAVEVVEPPQDVDPDAFDPRPIATTFLDRVNDIVDPTLEIGA